MANEGAERRRTTRLTREELRAEREAAHRRRQGAQAERPSPWVV